MNTTILFIDTSDNFCTVGITQDNEWIFWEEHDSHHQHASILPAVLDRAAASIGGYSQFKAISIIGGPGSYTGLRIAYGTAKGLCFALDIPLIALNKLDVMLPDDEINNEIQVALIGARLNEVYSKILFDKNIRGPLHEKIDDLNAHLDSINKQCKVKILYNSLQNEDLEVLKFNKHDTLFIENLKLVKGNWRSLALKCYKNKIFSNLTNSEPLYMKEVYIYKKMNTSE